MNGNLLHIFNTFIHLNPLFLFLANQNTIDRDSKPEEIESKRLLECQDEDVLFDLHPIGAKLID